MTDTAQSQNGARPLPGARRARANTEPPAGRPAATAVDSPPVLPATDELTWDRFIADQAPTDVLTEGGYIPPAAPEAPAEWPSPTRTLVKVLSLGMRNVQPGLAELAHRGNVRLIRSATWPRSVRIAVANPKGGSGKSTVAAVLGGTLASIRGGSVAIWDAGDAAGTLASRTEGTAARCVSEIRDDPDTYSVPSAISMVAATQTSFADVLGSLREREFYGQDISTISDVLDRTYRASVADTANNPHSPAFEAVIARADILVVPTILSADSVNKAVALLRRLQATPSGLVQRAVVAVLHAGGPETPGLAAQVERIFAAAGVGAVVHVPFDAHLGAGTAITFANLSHESQVAWTRLAAATVANITVTPTASLLKGAQS